jgi:hypothetical protein
MTKQLLKLNLLSGLAKLALPLVFITSLGNINAQCNINTAPPTSFGCSSGDQIDFFSINGISSPVSAGCSGGGAGYLNTSTVTWTITAGVATTFSANVGGGSSPEAFGIWIDLNKDGVYQNTENMFNNNPFLVHANTIAVPLAGVSTGTYNLRARCSSNGAQITACDNISGGEAEDYVVYIVVPGAALNFDGNDDYINTGVSITNALTGSNKMSAEAWVKPSVTGPIGSIVGNYNTPSSNSQMQFILRISGTSYQFFIGNGPSFSAVTSAVNTATINVWQHVAGTWDGAVGSIYINGVLSATASIVYSGFTPFTNPVWIGGRFGAEFFNGSIDEVRIWKRTLCQAEIQNNMNGEIATTGTNLIANYHFNQGLAGVPNPTVTTLTDASGNAYTGTLTGVALTGTTSNWVAPGAVTTGSTVTAFVSPTIAISGVNTICGGSSTTLTASGVSTYTWTSGPMTATNVVSPTVNTTYTVVGTNSLGCISNMATQTVTVNALPTVSVTSGSICAGKSFTMVPSGANTYTYSSGSAIVSPTANASYNVIGTSGLGCVSSNTAVSSVTVNALPTVTVNSGVISSGASFTMMPTGGVSYTYTPSGPIVSPTITSTYTVMGSSAAGCIASAISTVAVNASALNFDATAPGDNVVLPSAINTALSTLNKITVEAWVKPSSLSGTGCIIGNYNTPSNQMQFLIRRGGSSNYQFFIGNSSVGGYISVNSAASPTLNVWQHIALTWNGTVATCYINGVVSGSVSVTYPTMGVPTNSLIIGGNSSNENFAGDIDEVRIWTRALCKSEIQNNMNGEVATTGTNLIANYHFNQGVASVPNPTVTALTDASGNAYTGTLTGIALTGVTSNWVSPGAVTSGSIVTAFVSPTVTIAGTSSICAGSSTTLTASGVSTYTWTSGSMTSTNVVSPTANTTYSVVGTNSLGCISNMAMQTVTVNALPTVSVTSGAICSGSSYTMVPSGANTYTYSSGSAIVSPTANVSYNVTGTSALGCVSSNTAVSSVTVNALPTISAVTNNTLLCTGETATLTVSGSATTYTWSTTENTMNIAVSPTITTTYTVYGKNANGCVNTTTIMQNVSLCSGVNQITAANNELMCYPNPSNGTFNVNTSTLTKVTILNVLGKVIYSESLEAGTHQINLSAYANGLYLVKASVNGNVSTTRLIKE